MDSLSDLFGSAGAAVLDFASQYGAAKIAEKTTDKTTTTTTTASSTAGAKTSGTQTAGTQTWKIVAICCAVGALIVGGIVLLTRRK